MTSVGDPRIVGWHSWDEWNHVRKLLYSFDDTKFQIKGINMVKVWKSRLSHRGLPISVDLTAALVAAYVGNSTFEPGNEYEAQMSSAMAIVRFVNGVTDQHQKGIYAQSVQEIADKINIPNWMVDLRHEATHAKLPGFDILQSGLVTALNWLDLYYWEETSTKLAEKEQSFLVNLNEQLGNYADNVIDVITLEGKVNHKGPKEKNKIRQRKAILRDDTINTLIRYMHRGNLRLFINILLQDGYFVINQRQKQSLDIPIVSCQCELDNASLSKIIECSGLWKPLIDKFQEAFPSFLELIASEITKLAKKNDTSNSYVNYLLTIFMVFKCDCRSGQYFIRYLSKNPSHLGFQILRVIMNEGQFSDDIKEKFITFLDIFKHVMHALNSKSGSCDPCELEVTGSESILKGKEIINRLKGALEQKSMAVDESSESWGQISDITVLPPMGEFTSKEKLFHLDLDKFNSVISDEKHLPDNSHVPMESNSGYESDHLKDIIDNLFSDNTVYVGDYDVSSSSTDEYRCDDETVWDEDVDFNIDDKDVKVDIGSNFFFSHTKSLIGCDASKLAIF